MLTMLGREGSVKMEKMIGPESDKEHELARLRAAMGFIPRDSAPRRVIDGRYELERRIGGGGMGVVYLARDLAFGNAMVAIKLVRETLLREWPMAALGLRREAQRMAELRNEDHVVTVYDVGSTGRSTYLAMEFVDGQDLRKWLRAEKRSTPEILRAYLDAAKGLAAAHAIGVVHCDFKPDNVLIDGRGRAKVSDFGIATAFDEHVPTERDTHEDPVKSRASRASTRLSGVGGTRDYIAPERFATGRGDPRTDQFSFCVALWEALTGELPWRWHDRESQSEALEQPPAHPRKIPQVAAGPSLRRCLMRGLSKRPEERNPDMGTIIAALEWTLAWPKRSRRTGMFGGGLVAALAAGAAFALSQPPVETPASSCEPYAQSIDEQWNDERRAALLAHGEALGVEGSQAAKWAVSQLDGLARDWSVSARAACRGEQEPLLGDPTRMCLDRWKGPYSGAIELLSTQGDERTLQLAPQLLAELAPIDGDFCASASFVPSDLELGSQIFAATAAAEAGSQELAMERSQAALERAASLSEGKDFSVEWALAYAAHAEVLGHRGELDNALTTLDEAREHAIAVSDPSTQLHVEVLRAWILARERSQESARAGLEVLAELEPLYHASKTPPGALIQIQALETKALLQCRLDEREASEAGFAEAARGYVDLGHWVLAARTYIGAAELAYEQGRYDQVQRELSTAFALLELEDLPDSYRRIKVHAYYTLAIARFQASYDEEPARAAKMVDEAVQVLDMVAELAHPVLRRKAMVYACTMLAEHDPGRDLSQRIEQAEALLDATQDLETGELDNLRTQLLMAAIVGLKDAKAEQEARELLVEPGRLESGLRMELMWSLLNLLDAEQRCEDFEALYAIAAADEELMNMSVFADWVRERPELACN